MTERAQLDEWLELRRRLWETWRSGDYGQWGTTEAYHLAVQRYENSRGAMETALIAELEAAENKLREASLPTSEDVQGIYERARLRERIVALEKRTAELRGGLLEVSLHLLRGRRK